METHQGRHNRVITWEWTSHEDNKAVIYRDGQTIGSLTIYCGNVYEPHVEWLARATTRDKFLAIPLVLTDLAKDKPVMITARKTLAPFWDIWSKRGLLRKVGKLVGFAEFQEIHLYQVVPA